MKKAIAFRLDVELLELARASARADNRTLTNFVETALRQAVSGQSSGKSRRQTRSPAGEAKEGETRGPHS
jgi:hypothetical protein